MAELIQRSFLRDGHGPRVVDNSYAREHPRSASRHQRDAEDRGQRRSKRDSSHRPSKKDTSHHRRKSAATQINSTNLKERPVFVLDVIGQPSQRIFLGITIDASVMISFSLPAVDRRLRADGIDTSQLFAVASLVAESRDGEQVPMEGSIMTGQKLFDSVHPIPADYAEHLANSQPHRMALGYFSFPGLLIRQSGSYRLRTTLIQMDASGGTSIFAVDSELIQVERRSTATARRHQRTCC